MACMHKGFLSQQSFVHVVQKEHKNICVSTFNDLASITLKRLIRILRNPLLDTRIVTVVFDRYQENSVKSTERYHRGVTDTLFTHQIIGTRNVHRY